MQLYSGNISQHFACNFFCMHVCHEMSFSSRTLKAHSSERSIGGGSYTAHICGPLSKETMSFEKLLQSKYQESTQHGRNKQMHRLLRRYSEPEGQPATLYVYTLTKI